jgi:DHA1 family bicyclomycin/chloramphenicol resistance-like MFS transporter
VNSLGIVIGVQVSSRLAKFVGPQWILSGAVLGMILSASTIVALDMANVGLVGILVPLFFFITSCGFAFPCQQVLALAGHGGEAATAASVLGAVNFGLAGIISPIVGLFGIHNAIPMGGVMAITATVSLVVMVLLVRPRTVPALSH